MRLRRLFVSIITALGQLFIWLAVILRWLAKRLEMTAEPVPTSEPISTDTPEPAQHQPPAHWLAHVRRDPPADWLDKVRQGAPQLLDPQLRPSRPAAPPPPPFVRQASHRPPSAADRSRARPLKQVRFQSVGQAANQTGKQSPPVTPVSVAAPSAKAAFAGPPGSAPDSAEATDDGPPLPEGIAFPQAAFPESENQSEPTPTIAAPQPDIRRSEWVDSLDTAVPATPAATTPAALEIKPAAETAAPAPQLKQTRQRTLFQTDFPRPTPPENEPHLTQSEEKPRLPARPKPPARRSARAFEEIKQQPLNAASLPGLEASGAPPNNQGHFQPPEETSAADRFTTPPSLVFSQPSTPEEKPVVRPDYWPPLAAAPHRLVPDPESVLPKSAGYLSAQPPKTAARDIPPKEWPAPAARSITADLWPALPNSPLDDAAWEDDFYIEQQERRLRLDFEQRGPEWNE